MGRRDTRRLNTVPARAWRQPERLGQAACGQLAAYGRKFEGGVWDSRVNVCRMTNIFLMREGLGLEDRLTFHWAYVLNAVPRLGQRVVERIAERAGFPATEDLLAIAAKLPWG